jgi:hypothetical protein
MQILRPPQLEDFAVELSEVTTLELVIVPDKTGGTVRASLASLCVAVNESPLQPQSNR